MPNTARAVDQYIAKAQPFARPILERIRKAFHKAHPDVEETIKWGVPFFDYKGPLGNMAAFKQHVGWGFWKTRLMNDPHGLLPKTNDERTAMGGMRVTQLSDLPAEKVMVEYVREAIRLNEEGVKVARAPRKEAVEPEIPEDLGAALKKSAAARKAFQGFPPSHRREYVEWITGAKQDATRKKRLAQTIEQLVEGKPLNWKYMKK
jgi:uncharacterized protein YdeI (YjbR/CyaY-like superfamily)